MRALLTCDACGVSAGVHHSYEEWSDAAAERGWLVGEDTVICAECSRMHGPAEPSPDQQSRVRPAADHQRQDH